MVASRPPSAPVGDVRGPSDLGGPGLGNGKPLVDGVREIARGDIGGRLAGAPGIGPRLQPSQWPSGAGPLVLRRGRRHNASAMMPPPRPAIPSGDIPARSHRSWITCPETRRRAGTSSSQPSKVAPRQQKTLPLKKQWAEPARSRPSPTVIPLGKGECSLRKFGGGSASYPPLQLAVGGVAHAAVGAAEQTGDSSTERSDRNDSDNGNQTHQQRVFHHGSATLERGHAARARHVHHAPRQTR